MGLYRKLTKTVCVHVSVLATLLILQIALHFAASFFYFPLNLQNQQGCIAAPKHAWVGVYWVGPTLLYAVCVSLPFRFFCP